MEDYIKPRHAIQNVFNNKDAVNLPIKPIELSPISFRGVPKVKYLSYDVLPPKVDFIAIVWTYHEFIALNHIFFPSENLSSEINHSKWSLYQDEYETFIDSVMLEGNVDPIPSMALKAWGKIAVFELRSGKKLLILKSDMNLRTDGLIKSITNSSAQKLLNLEINQVPLTVLIEKMIKDMRPELIITTGIAGGTILDDVIGTVNVTNEVFCSLEPYKNVNFNIATYKGNPLNNKTVSCDWNVNSTLDNTILQKIPVTETELANIVEKINKKLSLSPPITLESVMNKAMDCTIHPKFNNYCSNKPMMSTNRYEIADTSGNDAKYSALEMDDYFVAVVAKYMDIPFGIIRNISDPVANHNIGNLSGQLLQEVQKAWTYNIYVEYGLYTSINSAIAILHLLSDL